MYAVLRMNTFHLDKLAASVDRMEEFDRIHTAQPGFAGSIVVDLGSGRRFTVNLWQDEPASRAALDRLRPAVDQLLTPLLSDRSEFVGAGPVVAANLARPIET